MTKKTIIQYEVRLRNYTLLGVDAAINAFFSPAFKAFTGSMLKEIVIVVRDGTFYHLQRIGDRDRISMAFINSRVNTGKVDF